jgi:hypothetical protein
LCDGIGSLSLGHRLPGVLGSRLDGYQLGQVANSLGAAADSSEQPDGLVMRTGGDHAEGQCAGCIAGGDTCASTNMASTAQRTGSATACSTVSGSTPPGVVTSTWIESVMFEP